MFFLKEVAPPSVYQAAAYGLGAGGTLCKQGSKRVNTGRENDLVPTQFILLQAEVNTDDVHTRGSGSSFSPLTV